MVEGHLLKKIGASVHSALVYCWLVCVSVSQAVPVRQCKQRSAHLHLPHTSGIYMIKSLKQSLRYELLQVMMLRKIKHAAKLPEEWQGGNAILAIASWSIRSKLSNLS